MIGPSSLEFAGVFAVLIAALICAIAAFTLRPTDRIRKFGTACGAAHATC